MKIKVVPVLLLFSVLIVACGTDPQATSTALLEQNEQKWLDQGVTSYTIEVSVIQSVWRAQSHRITVKQNGVASAEASCIPAPTERGRCTVQPFQAEEYIIAGLFAKARSQINDSQDQSIKITYDATYGFPNQISFDNPDAIDDDWTWRVTAFEVIK